MPKGPTGSPAPTVRPINRLPRPGTLPGRDFETDCEYVRNMAALGVRIDPVWVVDVLEGHRAAELTDAAESDTLRKIAEDDADNIGRRAAKLLAAVRDFISAGSKSKKAVDKLEEAADEYDHGD